MVGRTSVAKKLSLAPINKNTNTISKDRVMRLIRILTEKGKKYRK